MGNAGQLMPGGLLMPGVRKASAVAPPVWSPADLPSLVAWYKADQISLSDGDPVAQWDDLSGNTRHLVQATGAAKPTYKTAIVNGLPVVRFDGVDDYLRHTAGGDFVTGTTLTVAVVHVRRAIVGNSRTLTLHDTSEANDFNAVTEMMVYGAGGGDGVVSYRNGTTTHQDAVANDTPMLSLIWFDGTDCNQRHNGAAASTATAASTGTFAVDDVIAGSGFQGSAVANFCQDDVGEIIVCAADIGGTERTNLEAYTDRWGL